MMPPTVLNRLAEKRIDGLLMGLAIALGLLYLSQVARLTLFADEGQGHANLVPLRTLVGYLLDSDAPLDLRLRNLAGNVLILLPMGVLLATVTRLRLAGAAAVIVAAACAIEVLQFVLATGRSVDVDDVLLNAAGGIIGYLLGLLILRTLELVASRSVGEPADAPPLQLGRPG